MRRVILAVLVMAAALPGSAVLAQERSWLCETPAAIDPDVEAELQARSANLGMRRILEEYRERWDAEYMRAQCEAFANGRLHEISCLNGRRDWDGIEAMVPSELQGRSNSELRPLYLELQEEDDGYAAAIEYCQSVGAVK